jgi:ATP-binding cassette, subfamily B, bacterial
MTSSLRPLLWLAPYVLRHKGVGLLALLALVTASTSMVLVPVGVRRIVDHGFGGADAGAINGYFLGLIGVGVLLACASALRYFCVSWLGERVVADVQKDVFGHVLKLGQGFYETTQTGDLLSRLTADTGLIRAAVSSAISQTLRNLLMLVAAFVMMFLTSPKLTLLVLVAIPLIVLPLVISGRGVRGLTKHAQDQLAAAAAQAGESLMGIRTLQAFTNEGPAAQRFGAQIEAAFEATRKRLWARATLTAVAMALVFSSVVGVLWYGATTVMSGEMSAGDLVQFVLYAVFAAGALGELSEVYGEIQQAAGAAGRLTELMALRPEIASPANPRPLPSPAQGRVEFRNVGFRYPTRPDAATLENVSFTAAPGETVAIVGPSGAGKSTLFNLILRFHDASAGQVLIDGVAVTEADLTELRRCLALVPQDVTMFAETVAANIAYGTPAATQAAIAAAARTANADGFIEALPQGYQTLVGERGVTLSGGQRQRIAVARAVLRNAKILLLDEATSALDAESEAEVQKGLAGAMAGRTTLVIAHRLATIQRADRILVMEAGRIVEEGTHEVLSHAGGLYARLAAMQFRSGYAPGPRILAREQGARSAG